MHPFDVLCLNIDLQEPNRNFDFNTKQNRVYQNSCIFQAKLIVPL